MTRYVLKGSDLGAVCIAEAPSAHDALLWGYRNLSKVPGFTGGVENEDEFYQRTRAPLLESFRARYASEGASEAEAERMAEAAAGEPRRPALRVVRIEAQAPMLSRAGGGGKS